MHINVREQPSVEFPNNILALQMLKNIRYFIDDCDEFTVTDGWLTTDVSNSRTAPANWVMII